MLAVVMLSLRGPKVIISGVVGKITNWDQLLLLVSVVTTRIKNTVKLTLLGMERKQPDIAYSSGFPVLSSIPDSQELLESHLSLSQLYFFMALLLPDIISCICKCVYFLFSVM